MVNGLFLFILTFLGTSFAHAQWTLSDVSILYPLPDEAASSHLTPQDKGKSGQLLSFEYFKQVPRLDQSDAIEDTYKELVGVALRIDPSKKEIRIVYQPVIDGLFPMDAQTTQDMAVHVFYRLGPVEFQNFIASYKKIKANGRHPDTGLGVHPILLKENVQGTFSKSFKKLILSSIGQKEIYQVTFMQLISTGGTWGFGGFHVKDGNFKRFQIPRIKATFQEFTNVGVSSFVGSETIPAPLGADTFNTILDGGTSDLEVLRKEVAATHRVENPLIHTTDTMDCVSCHTAMLARTWAYARFSPGLEKTNFTQYVSKFKQSTEIQMNNLRIFGYFRNKPSVSQRVINESEEMVKLLK